MSKTELLEEENISRAEYLNSMAENVTITNGMAKTLAKNANLICVKCGLGVPRYPGANPKKCPNCGSALITKEEHTAAKKAKKKNGINQILGKVLDSGTPFPTN